MKNHPIYYRITCLGDWFGLPLLTTEVIMTALRYVYESSFSFLESVENPLLQQENLLDYVVLYSLVDIQIFAKEQYICDITERCLQKFVVPVQTLDALRQKVFYHFTRRYISHD